MARRGKTRKEALETYNALERESRGYDERSDIRRRSPASVFYEGIDPRRYQEYADGGMVKEDNLDIANLPREFVNKQYPRNSFYENPYMPDMDGKE